MGKIILGLLFMFSQDLWAKELCLVGTVSSSNHKKSLAIFAPKEVESNGNALYYDGYDEYHARGLVIKHIGESLLEKKVCDITSRYICLESEFGRLEQMINGHCLSDLDKLPEKKEIEVYGNQVYISRQYKEHLSSGFGLAKTLMQAASLPAYDSYGKQIGFSLWEIDEGSIYSDAGLLNGDVITAINGMQLSGASEAIGILLDVRSEDHWQLDILREGRPLVIQITIK